ncbi:MAG: DUF4132 domain-containing protein, partial [Pirellulaceae bacterium]|nr:DUF4132 domain-containing protein [Pirellulaceae bacterium]
MSDSSSPAAESKVHWTPAEKDYQLALENGKLVCQNPKGKQLASVPKWLKDTDLAQQILALKDWLAEHRRECIEQVEVWMLRSLPAPLSALSAVWQDASWREVLENLVVCAVDGKNAPDQSKAGFLKGADPKKGVGVVDLDGETQWLKSKLVLIPHPILLAELND